MMNKSMKNILVGVFAVVLVVVAVIWIFGNPGPEHMEDTNGADNYSLQTITEQDVVALEMGSRGSVSISETKFDFGGLKISDGKKYSSKKFTGVQSLYTATIFEGSDIDVTLTDFNIKEGNFAFYIVFDGKIVGQVEPEEGIISEFILKNVEKTGSLEYVIAGESANFSFIAPVDFN